MRNRSVPKYALLRMEDVFGRVATSEVWANPLPWNNWLVGIGTMQVAAKPGPRLGHELVYDQHLRQVLLLDGYWTETNQSESASIWAWGGNRWEPVPGLGPSSRSMASAVFDARRRRLVLYGGRGKDGKWLGDTWEWDGKSWLQMADASASARIHHAMAYDAGRGRVVMYGGTTREGWDTSTWEWDGARWARIAMSGPEPRAAFGMVYDRKRKQIVLFGGVGPPPSVVGLNLITTTPGFGMEERGGK